MRWWCGGGVVGTLLWWRYEGIVGMVMWYYSSNFFGGVVDGGCVGCYTRP